MRGCSSRLPLVVIPFEDENDSLLPSALDAYGAGDATAAAASSSLRAFPSAGMRFSGDAYDESSRRMVKRRRRWSQSPQANEDTDGPSGSGVGRGQYGYRDEDMSGKRRRRSREEMQFIYDTACSDFFSRDYERSPQDPSMCAIAKQYALQQQQLEHALHKVAVDEVAEVERRGLTPLYRAALDGYLSGAPVADVHLKRLEGGGSANTLRSTYNDHLAQSAGADEYISFESFHKYTYR